MRRFLACAMLLSTAAAAQAELTPDQVGIIAMAQSRNSCRLAEHYAAARGVPKSQVLLLPGKPSEDISRDSWEMQFLPAIRAWLTDKKLEAKIRCLVTSWDVPLKIGKRSDHSSVVVARRDYLGRARESRVNQLAGLLRVLDSLASNQPLAERPALKLDATPKELAAALDAALKAAQQRVSAMPAPDKQRQAVAVWEKAFLSGAGISGLESTIARGDRSRLTTEAAIHVEQIKGQLDGLQEGIQALSSLSDSVARDIQILNLMERAGGLLSAVQWIDAERELLEKNETQSSFDSELSLLPWPEYPLFRWQPNLLHYAYDALPEGRRTTMMVCRLAAPTLDLAMKLVDTAIATEKTGLTGKVYLDARGMKYDPKVDKRGSYAEYDQSLRELAERLDKHTKLVVVLNNKEELFQPGECPNAALYCGWYSLGKYVDAFQWRPGAVGYHLASMEAQTLTTPGSKVWCNAMLEHGICATLGPVYEPYLVSFPFPDDFFSLLLTGRYALVEVYYRTNPFNSWMMVLVGDPLYNPFKNNPLLAEGDLPERLKSAPAPAGASLGQRALGIGPGQSPKTSP